MVLFGIEKPEILVFSSSKKAKFIKKRILEKCQYFAEALMIPTKAFNRVMFLLGERKDVMILLFEVPLFVIENRLVELKKKKNDVY